jgi:hypothetical protein
MNVFERRLSSPGHYSKRVLQAGVGGGGRSLLRWLILAGFYDARHLYVWNGVLHGCLC